MPLATRYSPPPPPPRPCISNLVSREYTACSCPLSEDVSLSVIG